MTQIPKPFWIALSTISLDKNLYIFCRDIEIFFNATFLNINMYITFYAI